VGGGGDAAAAGTVGCFRWPGSRVISSRPSIRRFSLVVLEVALVALAGGNNSLSKTLP
jgi:hypothetical protein